MDRNVVNAPFTNNPHTATVTQRFAIFGTCSHERANSMTHCKTLNAGQRPILIRFRMNYVDVWAQGGIVQPASGLRAVQGALMIWTLLGSHAPLRTWRTIIVESVVSPLGENDHGPSTPS